MSVAPAGAVVGARRLSALAAVLLLFLAGAAAAERGQPARRSQSTLRGAQGPSRSFRLATGTQTEAFFQSEHLTVHALVRGGAAPRVVVATPAGNSGIGLWFKRLGAEDAGLRLDGKVVPAVQDGLHGVAFAVRGPATLDLDRVLLDSVRALRDEGHGTTNARQAIVRSARQALGTAGSTPEAVALATQLDEWLEPRRIEDPARPDVYILERRAAGSGARYRVELVPAEGTRMVALGPCQGQGCARSESSMAAGVAIRGKAGTRFQVRAFIERPPLEPLAQVLARPGGRNARTERNLGFLVYKQAFVAGSWQYLTYFGRDTLISAKLLGKRLAPAAQAAAIGSVLDRIGPAGEVAHEESVGDEAVLQNLRRLPRRPGTADIAALERPIYDYKMIDGEYLLPQLLDDFVARASAGEIREALTRPRVLALARALVRIADQSAPFARSGAAKDLVKLRPGEAVGNWRDSMNGLGGGRAPLDVNAYLVPSALRAIAHLASRPGFPRKELLKAVAGTKAAVLLASPRDLEERAAAWENAAGTFAVELDAAGARTRLRAHMRTLSVAEQRVLGKARLWSGVTVKEALAGKAAAELDGGVRFDALALDDRGRPIPVLSGDVAFELFYGRPTRERLLRSVTTIFQPYPIGLATPVGLLTASPAYSDRPGDAAAFGRDRYHGAVVWSWPMTMMRQGLKAQLLRFAGDAEVKQTLGRALATLDAQARATAKLQASELWSWEVEGGRLVAVPFGASQQHDTESNSLQLWSNTR